MHYKDSCSSCEISQEVKSVPGGIAMLKGGWTVNQYGGSEGFLGWLALQSRFHRMALNQLEQEELTALGPNIRDLDRVLTQYWKIHFPADDVIERVYIAYFFESPFRVPAEAKPYHFHIHLIPRFQSLALPGALREKTNGIESNDAWQMPQLTKRMVVPKPYERTSTWEIRAANLMNYIRHELTSL